MQNAALPFRVTADCGGQQCAEATKSPRLSKQSLYDWSARDEAVDDHDYCNDEQEMDQSSTHVHDEESENPQDEEYYRDGPKHDGVLARSELHVATQESPLLGTHPSFGCALCQGTRGSMATSMPELRNRPRFEELALRSFIISYNSSFDSAERRQFVLFDPRIHDVKHFHARGDHSVGDE